MGWDRRSRRRAARLGRRAGFEVLTVADAGGELELLVGVHGLRAITTPSTEVRRCAGDGAAGGW